MLSLTIVLTAMGFYCCYITSKLAVLPKNSPLVIWAASNNKISNYLGLALQTLGLILCVIALGLVSGIFSFLIILMTVASTIILIGPLQLIHIKQLALLFVIALAIELFL